MMRPPPLKLLAALVTAVHVPTVVAAEPKRAVDVVVTAPRLPAPKTVEEQRHKGRQDAEQTIQAGNFRLLTLGLLVHSSDPTRYLQWLLETYKISIVNLGCDTSDHLDVYVESHNQIMLEAIRTRYGADFWDHARAEADRLAQPWIDVPCAACITPIVEE